MSHERQPIANSDECTKALADALDTQPKLDDVHHGILHLIAAYVPYGIEEWKGEGTWTLQVDDDDDGGDDNEKRKSQHDRVGRVTAFILHFDADKFSGDAGTYRGTDISPGGEETKTITMKELSAPPNFGGRWTYSAS